MKGKAMREKVEEEEEGKVNLTKEVVFALRRVGPALTLKERRQTSVKKKKFQVPFTCMIHPSSQAILIMLCINSASVSVILAC